MLASGESPRPRASAEKQDRGNRHLAILCSPALLEAFIRALGQKMVARDNCKINAHLCTQVARETKMMKRDRDREIGTGNP